MDNLGQRYETAKQAVANFKEALDDFAMFATKPELITKEYRKERNSLIKCFELATDTLWKYLKFYLQETTGVVHNSPKAVFRECLRAQLLDEKEVIVAIKMVDMRNEATHVYRELIADYVISQLPAFYQVMNKLITKAIK